ncbi:tyrosine-type recombinase/integrase [Haloglomus halophilum]|uniref:tyrosine-type recombinase/integrase n=1 Tax=Haloglomus halophilum TaxID=2962672 RepID=UPI0020C96BAE|nr:site-specific integrase [Haloglomus halophilum]
MSKTADTSTDEPQTNQAESDLCDFLSERSELRVSFEQPDDYRNRRYDRLPVARTAAGLRADVSDFPSGKSDGRGSFSKKTYVRYRDTVNDFLQSQDVSDLENITPREISKWNQLLHSRDYARTTRDGKLETLGVFFKWAEAEWRAPQEGRKISETIARKRDDLDVSADEKSRSGDDEHRISTEQAEEVIEHLAKHDYASRQMVEFLLIYHIGCRKSALLSIDCSDVKPRDGIIQLRNRPEESGVRLKKGNKGERDVNIKPEIMGVVTDYINEHRTVPQDGTDALLTSWAGRIDDSTLYRDIAGLTKCGECIDDSGDALTKQNASDCPESIGCHDLRRVAITRMRDNGVSWDVISGRVNATVQMLKQHYDSPTFEQAAERRKEEVLNAL